MDNAAALTVVESQPVTSLQQFGEITIESLVQRRKKTVEVLERVMERDVHYGIIPGTGNKPSLYKAGAEVLAMTFGLAPVFKITRFDLASGHREYEIVCQLRHVPTGALLGEGVGSCSTMESKYRWRKGGPKCPTCGVPAIMRSRFVDKETNVAGWYCNDKRGGCGAQFPHSAHQIAEQAVGRIENADIADTYNTVLKMAKKRAQVDATLTALGVSDLLTQDLEDMDLGDQREDAPAPSKSPPPKTAKQVVPPKDAKKTEEPPRVDPHADKIAAKIIAALDDVTDVNELDTFAADINRLPKGTTARHSAWEKYQAVLKKLTQSQTTH